MAIDYGTKITGLATFCPDEDPCPVLLQQIATSDEAQLLKQLSVIIEEQSADVLVLGLPTYEDGNPSRMTRRVKNFGNRLRKLFPDKAFYFHSELYSSEEAESRLEDGDEKYIHSTSALIILEDFLTEIKNSPE